ncbi:hypothetical protein Ndes2437B_g08968 [Nannochloris sp. 'desiccata']
MPLVATFQTCNHAQVKPPPTTRMPTPRCGIDYEIRICTNKTCTRQGSKQILQFAKDLALPGVEISGCGCLGSCGNGPNAAVIPSGDFRASPILLYHLSTPHDLAEALTTVCGAVIDSVVLKCTELRLAGNSAALNNDFPRAISLYTDALDLNPSYGCHLLLSNRSAARLASGDATGALVDATAAVECCPAEFSKAWIRQADALFALGKYQDALEAVGAAVERYKPFGKSQEYMEIEKAIKNTIRNQRC